MSEDVPENGEPNAVAIVRAAYGLTKFYMKCRLGVTALEITDCENTPRWPHTKSARVKLIDMANEKGIQIGQAPGPAVL